MTTDTAREFDRLHVRLDAIDRRRRRIWVGAVVAVVAAAAVAVALAGVPRWLSAPEPVTSPSPSIKAATFGTSDFSHPFSLVLPAWVTQSRSVQDDEGPTHAFWSAHDCTTTCDPTDDFVVHAVPPIPGPIVAPAGEPAARAAASPAAYLAQISAWQRAHRLVISDASTDRGRRTARHRDDRHAACPDHESARVVRTPTPTTAGGSTPAAPRRLAVLDDAGRTLVVAPRGRQRERPSGHGSCPVRPDADHGRLRPRPFARDIVRRPDRG